MGPRPTTDPLRQQLAVALPQRPFSVRFWDGTELAATDGDGEPRFEVGSPQALAHVVRAPWRLGLSRAYIAGALAISDLDAFVAILGRWRPQEVNAGTRRRLLVAAVRAAGVQWPPRAPGGELRPRSRRTSRARRGAIVRRHFDVPDEFFALFLDDAMTYSAAVFANPTDSTETLATAQTRKLELVCTKLALAPGDRVLDVGCGWGSFAIHAATRHGVHVVAINPSRRQAALACERADALGLGDRIEIRVADYRDLAGERYDAIASIGMTHYVDDPDRYASVLASLLQPGGRLLNHGVARLRHADSALSNFCDCYAFPYASPPLLSRLLRAFERAGLVCQQVEGYGADYARTLTLWAERLDRNAVAAERLLGAQRLRVWRLYLRVSRSVFEHGLASVYQVSARRLTT